MPSWKLTIEYEGTRFSGWQEQKHARTVAGEIRAAGERFFNDKVDLTGAGRTDAGVHALGQVARLVSRRPARPEQLKIALNEGLPPDINILKVERCDPRFDPRRDAVRRYYLYQISTRRTAFAKKYVWWVKDRLKIGLMRQAALTLVGRHNFAGFCERRGDETSTVVVVEKVELESHGDLILFRIAASHYLWKMVRRLVGSLVEVGREKLPVEGFTRIIDAGDPSRAVKGYSVAAHTAPPSGLFLERVVYSVDDVIAPLAPVITVPST